MIYEPHPAEMRDVLNSKMKKYIVAVAKEIH